MSEIPGSRLETLGPEWFPKDDAEREQLFRRHIYGTRHSNWALLTNSARSSLGWSAFTTGKVLTTWSRQVSEGIHPAEIDLLVTIRYNREIVGPVLGAITASVFALESFTQVAVTHLIEGTHTSAIDRKEAWQRFETVGRNPPRLRSAAHKVCTLAKIADVRLSPDIKRRLQWLFSFRNDLAHDNPALFTPDGLIRRSYGSDKLHDPTKRYGEWMPSLHEGTAPVDVSHALEAARLHDAVVEAMEPVVREVVDTYGSLPSWRIARGGLVDEASIERTAAGWAGDYLQWRASITATQREDFYHDVVRKMKIKPIE